MSNEESHRHLNQEELELFLPRLREGRGGPREAHRRHLEGCRRCREELAGLRSVDELLAELPALEPSPGFAAAVMERVHLPMPWYRRVWSSVTERWLLAVLALLGGGATAGFSLWIAARPELSLGGLAGFAVERLSTLFWTLVVAAGRLVWESGIPDLVRDLAGAFEPLHAAAAMAVLTLTTVGVGLAMARLMGRMPPRIHAAGS